jgi:hypothetical protein
LPGQMAIDRDAKPHQIGNVATGGGLEANAHAGYGSLGVMFWSSHVRQQNIASPDGHGRRKLRGTTAQ